MSNEIPEITISSTPALKPDLVVREEEDGGLLYDPDSGDVRILNLSAVAVCNLLDGRRTIAEIVETLEESFAGMDADAGEQVLALVRDLQRIGVLGTMTELK